jgi:hypothetical protein
VLTVYGYMEYAPASKQCLEGGHRRAAPIEAEGEFVQVDLEVGVTNAVVGADQPGLEVAEDPVDAWNLLSRISSTCSSRA